jgi:hypothetical protein
MPMPISPFTVSRPSRLEIETYGPSERSVRTYVRVICSRCERNEKIPLSEYKAALGSPVGIHTGGTLRFPPRHVVYV